MIFQRMATQCVLERYARLGCPWLMVLTPWCEEKESEELIKKKTGEESEARLYTRSHFSST